MVTYKIQKLKACGTLQFTRDYHDRQFRAIPSEQLMIMVDYEKEGELSSIGENLYNFIKTNQVLEIDDISYRYHNEHTKLVDGNGMIIVSLRPADQLEEIPFKISEMKELNQKIRTFYKEKEQYACNEASSKAKEETLKELEEKLAKEKVNKKEKSREATKPDLLHVFLAILLVIMAVINMIR